MKFSSFFVFFLAFSQLSLLQAFVVKSPRYYTWDKERQQHFDKFNELSWRMYGLGLLSGVVSVECLNHQKITAAGLFGKAAIGCFATGIALSTYSNVDIKERRLKYEAHQQKKDAVINFVKSKFKNYQPADDAMEQHLLQHV